MKVKEFIKLLQEFQPNAELDFAVDTWTVEEGEWTLTAGEFDSYKYKITPNGYEQITIKLKE